MEQDFNQPISSPDRDALAWACEALGLETDNQAVEKEHTRGEATASFFNRLKSNDWFAADNTLEAAEIIHGKPGGQVPAFVRWHEKNQFQQLDDIIEWFANQLGEQDRQQLVEALKDRLSSFDSETISVNVRSYGKRIWQAACTVQSPTNESDLAIKKILQALFHTSTIRPTKRLGVRSRLVGKLKNEFSEVRLATARKAIRNYDIPKEEFHRPFLTLLTSDEESVERVRIKQPVCSGSQRLAYSQNFESKSSFQTQKESGNNWWLTVVVVASIVGLIIRVGGAVSKSSDRTPRMNPPAKMPMIKFDSKLAPDDPRSVETALKIMRSLQGKDSNLPTIEKFKELKRNAEEAQQRLEASKDAQTDPVKSDQFRPAEKEQKVERRSRTNLLDKNSNQSASKPTIPRTSPLTDPWGTLDKTSGRSMKRMRNRMETPQETVDKVMERHRKYEQFRKAENEALNKAMQKQQEMHNKILEDSMKRMEESRRRFDRMIPSRISPDRDLKNPSRRRIPSGGY